MSASRQHPHVCFVAPTAWPILARDRNVQFAGGAEVQQVFLGRALARNGYRVSMICLDYGQADQVVVDGIRVFKTHIPVCGIPVVRFFHPRLSSVWKALARVDADIYYQRAAGATTGIVGLFARRRGKRFVYAAAHDLDVARDSTWKLFQRRAGWRDRQLFTLGVKLADEIVVQHAAQAADCERSYGRMPVVIPSCYVKPDGARANRLGDVLWVSTLRSWKRPELFLELARRLPHLRFRMIGGPGKEPGAPELFSRIQGEARTLSNLDFVGFVPHASIEPYFDQARMLVNTSDQEGFPNTFLQAWARGVPSVSFCDTGSSVDGQTVGRVARDLDDMTSAVKGLMKDDAAWLDAGERARRCVEQSHTVDAAVHAYERVFDRLLRIQLPQALSHRAPAA